MKRIVIPAFLALALIGTNVQGQKRSTKATNAAKKPVSTAAWQAAYSDAGVTVSVDPKQTVRNDDGTYSVRLRWKYAADQQIEHRKTYRSMIETRLIDCNSVRTKPVRATTYDVDGKIVSSYDTRPTDMQYLSWAARKPGSANANALEGVCKTIKPS